MHGLKLTQLISPGPQPEGLGMALATCRSIIDAHNGRLWASANQPRGAVCQFTLPADQTTDVDGTERDL